MAQVSEATMIAQVVDRLSTAYADLPPDDVASVVNAAHSRFNDSPVREFVPLLVERRARIELASRLGSVPVWST